MESAKDAIDKENNFNLSVLPTLEGYLMTGITLNVKDDFPPYSDMTLVQYAIAKRKPKCLKVLLTNLKDKIKMNYDKIMFPDTSNTRCNLLKLAINFGSKCQYYDTEDNRCLQTLIDFGKEYNKNSDNHIFDVDLGKKTSETPLIKAIQYKNQEAIKLLMKNGANIFHPLKEFGETIQLSQVLSMPIMTLFKLHNNADELDELFKLFENTLGKIYTSEILSRLENLKVADGNNHINFISILENRRLLNVKEFLISRSKNYKVGIIITPGEEEGPQPDPEQPNANPERICSYEGCNNDGNNYCDSCTQYFCDEHIHVHGCA
ncbi:hypothetical protein M9Y10_008143 [Tritrichomonas musculus]|uniref:Ankyrin repeat protein n=1 Tax=Tritrichomonas musculus TaxID=1915356 RepID=A0ABR2IZN6_9EUKA